MDPRLGVLGWSQLASELRKLSGGVGSPSPARSAGGVLQFRSHVLIWPFGGQRKMTRSLLLVHHDRSQPRWISLRANPEDSE